MKSENNTVDVRKSLLEPLSSLSPQRASGRSFQWAGEITGTAECPQWKINVLDEPGAQHVLPLQIPAEGSYLQAWYESKHPNDGANLRETCAQAMRSEAASYRQEYRCFNRDGGIQWLHEEVKLELLEPGHWRVEGTCTDITIQKHAERAIHRSQEHFLRLFEQSADAIFIHDLSGRFVEVNPEACRNLGYSREELLGLSVPDIDINVSSTGRSTLWKDLKEGQPVTVQGRHRRKDGTTFPVEVRIALFDETEERMILVSARDVSERNRTEEALRQSETILKSFYESPGASRGIVEVYDHDVLLLSANAKAAEFFNETPESIKGRWTSELGRSPEEIQQWIGHYRRCEQSNQSIYFDFPYDSPAGRRWSSMTLTSLGKGTSRFAYIAHDITNQKLTEAALRESEERFRNLFEYAAVPQGIVTREGKFLQANAAMCSFLRYSEDELKSLESGSLTRSEDFARTQEQVNQLYNGEIPYFHEEKQYRRKDGRYVWGLLSATLVRDTDGNPLYLVGLIQDIDERKQSEEALRVSEERFREAMAHAPIGTALVSPEGQFIQVNHSLCNIVGYNEEELLSLSFRDITYPEDQDESKAFIQEILEGNRTTYQMEKRYLHKAGHSVWTLLTVSLVRDQTGEPLYFISQIQDISERRRMEKELHVARDIALETARLKSEFLANMSHEIRTPLNAIIGMTGLLNDTAMTQEQAEYSEAIQTAGEALLTVINDILDLSKMEAGKLELEQAEFTLSTVVEEAVNMLAERAQHKGIELAQLVHSSVPKEIRGDASRIRQVLLNLLSNAVKFTAQGEVLVRVIQEGETLDRVHLRFEVADTGIGISEDVRHRLFQPFMQADGSTTRQYGGTGLGLAISRRIVEQMGGAMGVDSVTGEGSTFWFTLPLEKCKATGETETKPGQRLQSLAGKRALIVDDNAPNRQILRYQTEAWGMQIEEAASGQDALIRLNQGRSAAHPFDLVLLDMQMEPLDGLAVARILSADPHFRNLPLVVMTSLGASPSNCISENVAACLSKPVRGEQLFKCLSEALGERLTVRAEEVTRPDREPQGTVQGAPAASRILVAEDNPVNQKVVLRQLAKLGYAAEIVENGQEVLKSLACHSFDLLLLDCQMPVMDGYETAHRIRAEETGSHLPIIALTANVMDGEREKCLAAGMDDYLSKPVKLEELGQALSRWFV